MTKCRHIAVDYFNLHSSGPKANGLNVAAIKYKKQKNEQQEKATYKSSSYRSSITNYSLYIFLNNVSILYTF